MEKEMKTERERDEDRATERNREGGRERETPSEQEKVDTIITRKGYLLYYYTKMNNL